MRTPSLAGLALVFAACGAGQGAPSRLVTAAPRGPVTNTDAPSAAAEAPTFDARGLSFTVATAGGVRRFQQGERIPLVLSFAASRPETYRLDGALYDRSGRLSIDRYIIAPAEGAPDPVADYFELQFGDMGGIRQMPVLTQTPAPVARDLNEYVRFDRPGRYTVTVETDRVRSEQGAVPLRAAPIEIEIVPADPAWAQRTLAEAVTVLDRAGDRDDDGVGLAARTLRYLGTEAATRAMARRLATARRSYANFATVMGLVGSPHRALARDALSRAVEDPRVPVTFDLFRTLALFDDLATRTERLGSRPEESDTAAIARWNETSERARAHRAEATARLAARVANVLPTKTPDARATTVHTLLEIAWTAQPTPAWFGAIAAQVVETLPRMERDTQLRLLNSYWLRIASPALLPFLRAAVTADDTDPVLRAAALQRLYDLAPAEGRIALQGEIRLSPSRLGPMARTALLALPAGPIPALDESLIAAVERRDHEADLRGVLLARYASPAVAARARAVLSAPEGTIGHEARGAILAYLLRADRPAGTAELRARLARGPEGRRDIALVLRHIAESGYTPEVEAAAIDVLADPRPAFAAIAADVLSRFGSAAARGPLVRRLAAWRRAWAPRAAELVSHVARESPHDDEIQLEYGLVRAIATARGYVLDAPAADALVADCVTAMACEEARGARRTVGEPVGVTVFLGDDGGASAHVAQYRFESVAALREKLAQYPRGTSVAITVVAGDPADPRVTAVRSELSAYAAACGMTVRAAP